MVALTPKARDQKQAREAANQAMKKKRQEETLVGYRRQIADANNIADPSERYFKLDEIASEFLNEYCLVGAETSHLARKESKHTDDMVVNLVVGAVFTPILVGVPIFLWGAAKGAMALNDKRNLNKEKKRVSGFDEALFQLSMECRVLQDKLISQISLEDAAASSRFSDLLENSDTLRRRFEKAAEDNRKQAEAQALAKAALGDQPRVIDKPRTKPVTPEI
jgi:hypothetical protein